MKFYFVLRNRKNSNGLIEKERLTKKYSFAEAKRWNQIFKNCGEQGRLELSKRYVVYIAAFLVFAYVSITAFKYATS